MAEQMQHATGPSGGQPCSRCGIRFSSKTSYLPCFEVGDDLKAWVARNADALAGLKGHVPDLLVEMASEKGSKE